MKIQDLQISYFMSAKTTTNNTGIILTAHDLDNSNRKFVLCLVNRDGKDSISLP